MAIHIQKGGSTEINLEKFSVGLGWHVRKDASTKNDFDLDVSAFMVDVSGKIPTEDYLVFYNSQNHLRIIEFVQLYRHNGTWKVKGLGFGHHDELDELAKKYFA